MQDKMNQNGYTIFLLFDTKFDLETVEKANLQIILFVRKHVVNAR